MRLNRKLGAIRADQGEFGRLAASFAEAAARAEDSVARLKVAAGAGQDEIERADRLADDLRYLLERGTSLADRLENAVTVARDVAPTAVRRSAKATLRAAPADASIVETAAAPAVEAAGRSPARHPFAEGHPRSKAERELLAALRSAGLGE